MILISKYNFAILIRINGIKLIKYLYEEKRVQIILNILKNYYPADKISVIDKFNNRYTLESFLNN